MDSFVHTGVMKTFPGIKIVSFCVLVAIIGVGVYAWAQGSKTTTTPRKYIVKFGDEENPVDIEPINYSPKEIKNWLKNRKIDLAHYKVRHYINGDIQPFENDDGTLAACSDAAPQTRSADPSPEPSASGTPTAGSKTQTAGAASFASPADAKAFIDYLNSAPPRTQTSKAAKASKE